MVDEIRMYYKFKKNKNTTYNLFQNCTVALCGKGGDLNFEILYSEKVLQSALGFQLKNMKKNILISIGR